MVNKYLYFMNKVADLGDGMCRGWSCPELTEIMKQPYGAFLQSVSGMRGFGLPDTRIVIHSKVARSLVSY